MDIPLVLDRIRPNADWGFRGEDKGDYSLLDWRDKSQTKPTKQEVIEGWNHYQANKDKEERTIKEDSEFRSKRALATEIWLANQFDKTPAEVRNEIKAIYRGL